MLFCNIGWMNRYQGLRGQPDKIVGGGKWVSENEHGHEACNFLVCRDGFVYGHVETIWGKTDRRIRIESIGGEGDSVDGVDVVWTATDPEAGGRKVVGWYRNATVFRSRQHFVDYPSKQHERDEIGSFRIRALADDVRRLDLEDRSLSLGRGIGWMGQTAWWVPSSDSPLEVRKFVGEMERLLGGRSGPIAKRPRTTPGGTNSPSSAASSYVRYVETYEVQVLPRHTDLQKRFHAFVVSCQATEVSANLASVDLRYRDAARGQVLVEVKPCEEWNARFAIRTAMGQLLDYQQRVRGDSLLIVLEAEPNDEDQRLATGNGFGVAFPVKGGFKFNWPP